MTQTLTPEQEELAKLHPHHNPEEADQPRVKGRLPLKPGIVRVHMHLAVRTFTNHITGPIIPIGSKRLDPIDGHGWELFSVSHLGCVNDRIYVWGMFVLGLGFFNVMVPVEFTRRLSAAERESWAKTTLGMVGSHGGGLSYTLPSGVTEEA